MISPFFFRIKPDRETSFTNNIRKHPKAQRPEPVQVACWAEPLVGSPVSVRWRSPASDPLLPQDRSWRRWAGRQWVPLLVESQVPLSAWEFPNTRPNDTRAKLRPETF